MSEDRNNSGRVTLVGLLLLLFVALKLTGIISWSWWWVLSPIWIVALLSVFFVILFFAKTK